MIDGTMNIGPFYAVEFVARHSEPVGL